MLSEPNYSTLQRGDYTGSTVWDSSVSLASWLSIQGGDLLRDKRVLELGAGRGAVSFAVQRMGAAEVWVTDGEAIAVPWHRVNGALNRRLCELKGKICGSLSSLCSQRLVWGDKESIYDPDSITPTLTPTPILTLILDPYP